MFYSTGVQALVPGECIESSWRCNDDVWDLGSLQQLLVLLHRRSSIKDGSAHGRHVPSETTIFVFDLEGELAGMAEDDNGDFVLGWIELLKGGKHEDSGLSVSGFGLAENIHSKDCLGNAFLLDY